MEDVTGMFSYFVALPLLLKNLTQNYCLPNFLIFDQLNRTFHIEIRLVDNFKLLKIDLSIKKNSFKCMHARMSVFSGTQGK